MKKKLIATLVAGAVLSTGLIGLTACGGGLSINKGEKVDADGWTNALKASVEAKNYTVEQYEESSVDYSGEILGTAVSFSVSGTDKGTEYTDIENSTSYLSTTGKVEVKGDVPEAMKDQYKNSEVKSESYVAKVNDKVYRASYNNATENAEWSVSLTYGVNNSISYLFYGTYSTTKDGEEKSITELYEAFTYDGGVYSATLYSDGEAADVSISVKGGYVVGLSIEYSMEQESYGMTMKMKAKTVSNFSNYGSTTVKPSDAAKKAIDDYLAE